MIIDPKKIVIIIPNRKGLNHRITAVICFILFWGALAYLLRPLLMIIGWWLGYGLFGTVTLHIPLSSLINIVLFNFLPLILLLSGSLWGWAIYNRARFRGHRDKRRVPPPTLTLEEIAAAYSLTVEEVSRIRGAKGLVYHFQNSGAIEAADCCHTPEELCQAYNRHDGAALKPPAEAWPTWEPTGAPLIAGCQPADATAENQPEALPAASAAETPAPPAETIPDKQG